MSFLYKDIVLVLNKNWQAINITQSCDALSMMYTENATGLNIIGNDNMVPLKWKEWIKLSCEDEFFVQTINGKIKIPKVIILCNFNKIPKKRPKFTNKNIWARDNATCQYTGKKLNSKNGNIDHIIPKSKGGETSWTNCVLAHKDVNSIKANRTPDEAGLKLIKSPQLPKIMPVSYFIQNKHNIKEWEMFLNF